MASFDDIDLTTAECGDLYDECSLWSARFGMMLLDRVTLRPGMTILDVGAGTGFLSMEMAQRCGSESTVIAVDPWDAAMKRLTRKVAHLGLRNVRALVNKVETIDLPDSSVDLIVSNLGINNFDYPVAALKTCFRVAKPGASLFLTTNLVGHMAEFYEVYRSVLVEIGLPDRIAALDAHANHRATVESLRELLDSAGFQIIEVATSSFRERFLDGTSLLRHYFTRLAFVPGWKSVVSPEQVVAIFQSLEQRLNFLAARHGQLELTIPTACVHASKPH